MDEDKLGGFGALKQPPMQHQHKPYLQSKLVFIYSYLYMRPKNFYAGMWIDNFVESGKLKCIAY